MMDLATPVGAKIIFNNPTYGWDWDQKAAARHLKVGAAYTVSALEVGSSESHVQVEEVPSMQSASEG